MTTPSLAYKVLYEIRNITNGAPPQYLNKILLTGEHISKQNTENMRHILQPGSTVKSFVYGSSETATLMYGLDDCSYAPICDDFVFEIVADEHVGMADQSNEFIATGRLLVTWLRDGMLPIFRYDTGDVFSVYTANTDCGYALRSKGRANSDPEFLALMNWVDRLVYGLPSPIYHYQLQKGSPKHTLSLITDPGQEAVSSLMSVIKDSADFENIEVVINPADHPFYEFSPLPKLPKYTN